MRKLIEMHVRYRGSERFLRLVRSQGEWHAALMIPGKEDLLGECPPRAPLNAILPQAEFDDMVLKIEAPAGTVVSLAAERLIASDGIAVEDGWIAVPLHSIIRDYKDCKGDRLPEPALARVFRFPTRNAKDRDVEMDR